MPLKLVMMGTGSFAAPTFAALYDTPHQVVGLYTQPDRTGEGHHRSTVNPLVQIARERNTPVFQPPVVNTPEALAELRSLDADVFVVAAYGQILSPELLAIPRLIPINVHASLLPKYRGASPISAAILNGETESGVSIIEVVPPLDAGPVLGMVSTPIGPRETTGELEVRLSHLGAKLTAQVLDEIAAGTAQGIPQDDRLVTRARKLSKAHGAIDWNKTPAEIDRHIRGMQPWPTPFTFVYFKDRAPLRMLVLAVQPREFTSTEPPGTVLQANQQGFLVQTGGGCVEIERVQPQGKRPMSAADFVRGNPVVPGTRLGPEQGDSLLT